MSQILHIHHTNEVWHIQAALYALQHSSLEDFPALGLPAHLTCSSLHTPPSPTAISLFFCWHLSVRLAFDTLSISARYKKWCQCRQQPKQAGFIPSATSRYLAGWGEGQHRLWAAQGKEPCSSETDHFKEQSLLLSQVSLMHLSSWQSLSTSERMSL